MLPEKFWSMKTTKMKNEAGEDETAGEVLIYGPIMEDKWHKDDVTPKAFHDELVALGDVKKLQVRINSYGGHVSAGSAIYSLLKQHPADVTVHIDGFALSAASVIAMAGDTVIMPGNAMMMIHNPAMLTMGDSAALRKDADMLDKMRESMIAAYNAKTGIPRDELIAMLDAETWMTADEAAGKGFANEVSAPLMAAACARNGAVALNGQEFDLLKTCKNIPQSLREIIEKGGSDLNVKNSAQATHTQTAPESAPADAEAVRREAVRAERERQKAIDELAVPGMEGVIAKAKYESGDSPEAVALAILRAQKQAGAAALTDRQSDAAASGVNSVSAAVTGDGIGAGAAANQKSAALNAEIKKRREMA